MSIELELPAELSRYTNGQSLIEIDGVNVQEVLENLCIQFPDLRVRVLDANGDLYPYLPVFRGKEKLPLRNLATINLHEGERLEFVALASGG